jgi:hypothetical protein
MAALKTTLPGVGTPQLHVTDPQGNHVVVQHVGANITIGTASTFVVLSKQNVTDILASLTAFSNTGQLS